MVRELRDYFFGLAEDTSRRIVVLRGAGRAFCAGLDISEAAGANADAEQPVGRGWGFQGYLADVYVAMRRCPQPIVSLVHGAACGGGFAFVLASDIRIAADTAKMNAAFIRIGLSACDMGVSYFLPRLVGTSVASELMLTGRFLHAERALATGLVSEVVAEDALADAGAALPRRDAHHLADGVATDQGGADHGDRRQRPRAGDGDREPQPGAVRSIQGLP